MHQIQLALIISYVLMSCYFFANWLRFALRHPHSSPEDKFLSFLMFLITTIFWPLIVPVSLIEVVKTRKIEATTIIPVVLAMIALSISYLISEISA
ncbi:hypothetical protein ACQFX9_22070 [Aliinostoc sp. HNIBRCY26]|uniref:hypothetical protein n=1 Tax=Aliinostoc sp. HNIBRCY26 TaxID=3418997 RepID=UPI003CFEE8F0